MRTNTYETIVAVLINSKSEAEKNNKDGINDEYIYNIDNALADLMVQRNQDKDENTVIMTKEEYDKECEKAFDAGYEQCKRDYNVKEIDKDNDNDNDLLIYYDER